MRSLKTVLAALLCFASSLDVVARADADAEQKPSSPAQATQGPRKLSQPPVYDLNSQNDLKKLQKDMNAWGPTENGQHTITAKNGKNGKTKFSVNVVGGKPGSDVALVLGGKNFKGKGLVVTPKLGDKDASTGASIKDYFPLLKALAGKDGKIVVSGSPMAEGAIARAVAMGAKGGDLLAREMQQRIEYSSGAAKLARKIGPRMEPANLNALLTQLKGGGPKAPETGGFTSHFTRETLYAAQLEGYRKMTGKPYHRPSDGVPIPDNPRPARYLGAPGYDGPLLVHDETKGKSYGSSYETPLKHEVHETIRRAWACHQMYDGDPLACD